MSDLIPGNTFSNGQLVTADDLNKLVTNAVIKDGAIVAGHITTSDITQSIFNFPVLNPEDIGNNDYLLLWSVNENGFKRVKKEDIAGMVVADDGTQIINPDTGAVEGTVQVGKPVNELVEGDGFSVTTIDKATGSLSNQGPNGRFITLKEGVLVASSDSQIQFDTGVWILKPRYPNQFRISRGESAVSYADQLAVTANVMTVGPELIDGATTYTGGATNFGMHTRVQGASDNRRWWYLVAYSPTDADDDTVFGIECTAPPGSTGNFDRKVIIGRDGINHDLTVWGNISMMGTGNTKQFRISHPVLEGKDLVHCAIEAPKADLIYRGKGTLASGACEIDIDDSSGMSSGTFDSFVKDIQVFLQNDDGWDRLKGYVSQGKLHVECENPESNDEFSWLVVGTRNDVTLEVEPESMKMPG